MTLERAWPSRSDHRGDWKVTTTIPVLVILLANSALVAAKDNWRYFLAAAPESAWTFYKSEHQAQFARLETDELVLEISEFSDALGLLTGSVVVTNKTSEDITLLVSRLFLQDAAGFVGEPAGYGQGWNFQSVETVPGGAKKAGNVSFPKSFTALRKGQDLRLLVKGVRVKGQEVEIPELTLIAPKGKKK